MAVESPGAGVSHEIRIDPPGLDGLLAVPRRVRGLVIFAHGTGSGRNSPRNKAVAEALDRAGFATLLFDLLKPGEDGDRANVFDVGLLAARLTAATDWARQRPELAGLRIGYFGASTGAAAALAAAADDPEIAAIVSRGGRPDFAGDVLGEVEAPTLLIVGGADQVALPLNKTALKRLAGEKKLVVVPGAKHLFEEPGALDAVIDHARHWFAHFLPSGKFLPSAEPLIFADRRDAGRRLAAALAPLKGDHPIVLALPRGGVPVGFEVAKALAAPLEIVLVRKLRAPGRPELGLGAVVEGNTTEVVLNDDVVRALNPDPIYIESEKARQLLEIERRRWLYRLGRAPLNVGGRTLIVVDDGIATGGTVRAVLRAFAKAGPAKLVLAVPVAPPDALESLAPEVDEVVCLSSPDGFGAVGAYYKDFAQVSDQDVVDLLQEAGSLNHATDVSTRERLSGGR